jgi:hypothetical protein
MAFIHNELAVIRHKIGYIPLPHQALEVVFALSNHYRRAPCFKSGEDVIKNHLIASFVVRQGGIEFVYRHGPIRALPFGTERSFLDDNTV